MSRTENETRSLGGRADPFRILRLYSIEKKDPKRPGPARKTLQLTLEHLPPELAPLVREQIEGQLRPQQVLEIDGVIVARGGEVGTDDVEAPMELRGDLGEAYSFAHRMLWEVYERETAAIDRLTERSTEMFNRTQGMTTQLLRAIQETLELQAALRAIFEGETLKKEQRAPGGDAGKEDADEESAFSTKNIKDWVQGLGTVRDLVAELAKITKDFKASQAAGAGNPGSGP
ncbi:hypothetical protein [Nannocystis radixulma]|uniref:Uncharacterized protein n=1 Tax=Nannocystis radixulma TaxID=2995305 RepID=A0ABT5BPI7_9BACT|nr:hypothetical protein [Nannocystis radixulma]MDC0676080.1 hypothetical protein [Nannocystis radixulma]